MIVFIKMIVFKNDRYSFSKSSKQVGRFKNDRVFLKKKLSFLKTIGKRKKRSFSKMINNPTYRSNQSKVCMLRAGTTRTVYAFSRTVRLGYLV